MSTTTTPLCLTPEPNSVEERALSAILQQRRHVILHGRGGTGKCLEEGTKIRRYDGSIVAVEHVVAGDLLIGDDGQPRTVRAGSLTCGVEPLYEILPMSSDMTPFVATGNHILVLQYNWQPQPVTHCVDHLYLDERSNQPKRRIIRFDDAINAARYKVESFTWEVSVVEFLRCDDAIRSEFVLFASGPITFSSTAHQSLEQRLGVILNGTARRDQVLWAAQFLGIWLRESDQLPTDAIKTCSNESMRRLLLTYDLMNNQHVPPALITDSLEVRRHFLAGLTIDDERTVSDRKGIRLLAHSLGLGVGIKSNKLVMMLDEHRRAHFSISRRAQPTKYYGFEVSGINHRFLLEDLTVTHNSHFVTNTLLPTNEARKHPFNIALTGPTGISASLLGGVTIHSWAGLGLGMSNGKHSRQPGQAAPSVTEMASTLAKQLFRKPEKVQEIRDTDILLLDEISMVGADLFDLTDQVLRIVRHNVYEPFGGLQLILLGDVMQLSPVKAEFFFHSRAWVELCGGTDLNAPSLIDFFVFNQCRRFDNLQWFDLLSRVRMGQMTSADKDLLRTRMISVAREEELKDMLFVTGRIFDVDNENNHRQSQLPGPDYQCQAVDYVKDTPLLPLPKAVKDVISRHFSSTTPDTITLRIGTRVMLRKNLNFSDMYVNGSTGRVVSIQVGASKRSKELSVKRVLVQFDPLVPALQQMVDRRQAELAARQLPPPKPVGSQSVDTLTSSLRAVRISADGNEADDEDDDEPERKVPVPLPPPGPLEEDVKQRRIWIEPAEYEVPFNKQSLGIRRTVIGPFSMGKEFLTEKDDVDVLDVPESGDALEDEKMRQLASSRGATVKIVRCQIPLILAYSLTVHKVQGATFSSGVRMDLGSESIFSKGMAYVLLSRTPSIEGVHLTRFDPLQVRADPDAMDFAQSFQG